MVDSLKDELFEAQIEKFENEFSRAMKKEFFQRLKRALFTLGIVAGGIISFLVFKSVFIPLIVAGVLVVNEILQQIGDVKKELKIGKYKNHEDVFDVLYKYETNPIKAIDRDFCRSEYLATLDELGKEQLHVFDNEVLVVKSDVIAQIVYEIELFTGAYKLPNLDFSSTDWDRLF